MGMTQLLDMVTLKSDRPDLGLRAGSQGAVVDVHEGDAFEVEFTDPDGRSIALATLRASDLAVAVPAEPHAVIEIYRDAQSAYHWRLKSAVGEVIAESEAFAEKAECRASIADLRRNVASAEVADRTAA
jgi:uncharacterized protein YegP (UPF0339 family)